MRAGIIGCGAIGSFLAREIDRGNVAHMKLVALFDIDLNKVYKLVESLEHKPQIADSFEKFLKLPVDFVIEAASQQAVFQYAEKILKQKKPLLLMSAGALADDLLREKLFRVARENNTKIYIPSGAIAGLDGLKAMSNVRLHRARLTTRKSHSALGVKTEKPVVVFSGNAHEAAKRYPQNINVAIAFGLAAHAIDILQVEIVADPGVSRNIHTIEVEGEAGKLEITLENFPFPDNPKTSFLAALSALQVLKNIASNVVIGG